MEWFIESKAWEWIFSGVGVVILVWVAKSLWRRKRGQPSQDASDGIVPANTSGDDIYIKSNGDVTIAKDHGKSIQVKNSNIGVIGDQVDVKDGIRFKEQK
jgi:hypothetical protein